MLTRTTSFVAFLISCMFFSSKAQNVGIGTATPESKLQVTGKITTDSLKIIASAGNGKVLTSDSAGNARWMPSANITQANNGIVVDTGTIQLGGILTKRTNIDINNNQFKIGRPGPLLSGMLVSNPANAETYPFSVGSFRQSFTSPRDAVLDSIQIIVRNLAVSNLRAFLYEGQGVSGVPLDSSALLSYPAYSQPTPVTILRSSQPMIAGKFYTIYIPGIGGWEVNTSNPYPLGTANLFGADFCFTVYGTYHQDNGFFINSNGELKIFGPSSITGNSTFEFGADAFPKEANAGKIGYQVFTPDALDIVGAGTEGGNRKVSVWAEGGTTFKGPVIATSLSVSGTIAQEALQVPALLGGWVAYGSGFAAPVFWKDKEGVVHLQGLIGNAAPVPINGTILFTLPTGYRPPNGILIFSVLNNNQLGRIDILGDGSVIAANISSNAWINLSGISFRVN
jgi:hypothetical protein